MSLEVIKYISKPLDLSYFICVSFVYLIETVIKSICVNKSVQILMSIQFEWF